MQRSSNSTPKVNAESIKHRTVPRVTGSIYLAGAPNPNLDRFKPYVWRGNSAARRPLVATPPVS